MASCRVFSPPAPAIRSGFKLPMAPLSASAPVKCAPSACKWPASSGLLRLAVGAEQDLREGVAALAQILLRPDGETQQHRRNIGGRERGVEIGRKPARVFDRGRDQVEARRRARGRRGLASGCHGAAVPMQGGARREISCISARRKPAPRWKRKSSSDAALVPSQKLCRALLEVLLPLPERC